MNAGLSPVAAGDRRRTGASDSRLRLGLARLFVLQCLVELPIQEVLVKRGEIELPGRLVDQNPTLGVRVLGKALEDPGQGALDVRLSEAHVGRSGIGVLLADRSRPQPLPLGPRTLGRASRLGRIRSAVEKSSWLVAGPGTAATAIPAALAARTPFLVSWTTKHRVGSVVRRQGA